MKKTKKQLEQIKQDKLDMDNLQINWYIEECGLSYIEATCLIKNGAIDRKYPKKNIKLK